MTLKRPQLPQEAAHCSLGRGLGFSGERPSPGSGHAGAQTGEALAFADSR